MDEEMFLLARLAGFRMGIAIDPSRISSRGGGEAGGEKRVRILS